MTGMKVKETTYAAPAKQILAIADHYLAAGITLPKDSALAVTVSGRKIVKAGTIYPANDKTAEGLVLNDYDVTDGDQAAALVYHAVIKTAAIPVAPVTAAMIALPMIKFTEHSFPVDAVKNA